MYEGLTVNFWLWHIVGGVYGYKELIRLPRKQKYFAGYYYSR